MTPKETLSKWINDNAGNIEGGYLTEHRGQSADRIIEALAAAGYIVVPKEPTDRMVYAGAGGIPERRSEGAHCAALSVYERMIDAALSGGE